MTDDFKPPIKSRSTEDLLQIVGAPHKWKSRAVKLAIEELNYRKIDSKKIDQAKYLASKRERIEKEQNAKQRFHFTFNRTHNLSEIFLFLFSWELEKDGFIEKARFQRKYRPIVILVLLMVFIFWFINKFL